MAITLTEGFERGDLDSNGGTTTWVVNCASSDTMQQVRTALLNGVAATWSGFPLYDIRVKHVMDTLYLAEAIYKRSEKSQPDNQRETAGCVIDFDTTGETQHITTSLGTTSYAPAGVSVLDVKGVIGFDGKKVAGVDIISGIYRFCEEWQFPSATYTYRQTLKSLTGKVNNATFRGFAAGEVMFVGASGRRINGGLWSVSFRFSVSENVTNLAVGDITVSAKQGWQYLDVMMEDDTNGSSIVQVPKQANVHTVYRSGNFSLLNIGTGTI